MASHIRLAWQWYVFRSTTIGNKPLPVDSIILPYLYFSSSICGIFFLNRIKITMNKSEKDPSVFTNARSLVDSPLCGTKFIDENAMLVLRPSSSHLF
jgi:hypothetical protein